MFSSVSRRYTGDLDKEHYQGPIDEVLEDQDLEGGEEAIARAAIRRLHRNL